MRADPSLTERLPLRRFSSPPTALLLACVCLTLPGVAAAQAPAGVLDIACPVDKLQCENDSPYFHRIRFGGRTAVSDISSIAVSVVNGPGVETAGVDVKAEYRAPAGWGEWSVGMAGTRTLSWKIDAWLFGPAYDAIGRLNYDTPLARTVLDWKGRVWLNVGTGNLNMRWTVHHTAAYRHGADTEPVIRVHNTHDLTMSWAVPNRGVTVDAAILNLTDREPPRVLRQHNYDPLTQNPVDRDRHSPSNGACKTSLPTRCPSIRAVRRSTLSNRSRIAANSDRISTAIQKNTSKRVQMKTTAPANSGCNITATALNDSTTAQIWMNA